MEKTMDTTKGSNKQQKLSGFDVREMSNPIETGSHTRFDNLPLDTLKHGFFVGKNNFYVRRGVPASHKKVADNFMIIKKVFGYPVVHPETSQAEKDLLAKYDFNLLEFSTSKQIEDEIVFLKKWSNSANKELQAAADEIVKIRCKELKALIATNYVAITNQVYNGHKVLESYFEEISKYYDS